MDMDSFILALWVYWDRLPDLSTLLGTYPICPPHILTVIKQIAKDNMPIMSQTLSQRPLIFVNVSSCFTCLLDGVGFFYKWSYDDHHDDVDKNETF